MQPAESHAKKNSRTWLVARGAKGGKQRHLSLETMHKVHEALHLLHSFPPHQHLLRIHM